MNFSGGAVGTVNIISQVTCDEGEGHAGRPPVFDRNEFLERMGGDEQLLPEFIELFRKVVSEQLEALGVAVDRRDVEGVRMYAHAVKGSSANIAALRLLAVAETMENSARAGDLTTAVQGLKELRSLLVEFNQVTGEG